jgi:hypothetical protein
MITIIVNKCRSSHLRHLINHLNWNRHHHLSMFHLGVCPPVRISFLFPTFKMRCDDCHVVHYYCPCSDISSIGDHILKMSDGSSKGTLKKDGIFCLCYYFCKLEDEVLVSIRYFPDTQLVVAVTDSGRMIQYSPNENMVHTYELSCLTLQNLIEQMKRILQGKTELYILPQRALLGWGLLWQMADAYGLQEIWEEMLHPNAEMFGFIGKESILKSKQYLLGVAERKSPNYRINAIHDIDTLHRVVVANFECLLKGKEGLGIDILKFDEDWKVIRVEALRH